MSERVLPCPSDISTFFPFSFASPHYVRLVEQQECILLRQTKKGLAHIIAAIYTHPLSLLLHRKRPGGKYFSIGRYSGRYIVEAQLSLYVEGLSLFLVSAFPWSRGRNRFAWIRYTCIRTIEMRERAYTYTRMWGRSEQRIPFDNAEQYRPMSV